MSFGSEEKEAVLRVMERGILSGYQGNWSEAFYGGPEILSLELEWADYFGVKHAICCNSATSGLWLACAAIGLNSNKQEKIEEVIIESAESGIKIPYEPNEIIVTPYSMTCSASIPLHFGAKPVFADIEKDYYCLSPEAAENAITERTKAIIVVDLFGQPYDADAINAIAKKHGLYVIEDAAQAIGAKYKGKYAGTLGDIGVFSLNRHKHINCGEGGVVVTDNDELAFRIRLLVNHAEAVTNDINRMHNHALKTMPSIETLIGMNMRMTELQAAIAREQLKKLPGILKKVREHAKYFPVKVRPECEHAFYRYAIDKRINPEKFPFYRNTLTYWPMEKFNVKEHYIQPIYKMPLFKSLGYPDNICPVCEDVEENIVLAWLKGMG